MALNQKKKKKKDKCDIGAWLEWKILANVIRSIKSLVCYKRPTPTQTRPVRGHSTVVVFHLAAARLLGKHLQPRRTRCVRIRVHQQGSFGRFQNKTRQTYQDIVKRTSKFYFSSFQPFYFCKWSQFLIRVMRFARDYQQSPGNEGQHTQQR